MTLRLLQNGSSLILDVSFYKYLYYFSSPWNLDKFLLICDIYFTIFSAIMDGIDLDIEGGDYKYYPEFITKLRMLMDNDQSKEYLITGAPQCPYPDHHLGPEKPGSGKCRCTPEP